MFWLRNEKIIFSYTLLSGEWGSVSSKQSSVQKTVKTVKIQTVLRLYKASTDLIFKNYWRKPCANPDIRGSELKVSKISNL